MRLVTAAILGGIVFFVWGAISHMVLPLGEMGLKALPNEEPVLLVLRQAVPEPGLYFFPGMDMSHKATPEEEKAWNARYAAGPIGLLLFHPTGEEPLSPKRFLLEFATDFLAALAGAALLMMSAPGFVRRLYFGFFLGFAAWFTLSVPQWNWYGFPSDFVFAEGVDVIVGWMLGAVAMGWWIDRRARRAVAAPA